MIFSKKLVSIAAFTVSIAALALFFIRATHNEEDKMREEFEQYYKIYSLHIPDSLWFAGEIVPMNDFDVKERYDKELLTNVYWQSQTLLMIKRANRFFPTISAVLKKNNIPDDFKYLAIAESGLQNVVSPAGASGYWQFLDKTGKMYGLEISDEIDERYHIERSTEAACKYFKESYAEFHNWALVAASYNMGIDGVRRQLQSQKVDNYYDLYLNTETSRYVLRTLAFKQIMESPAMFGFKLTPNHLYKEIPTITIKVDTTIKDLAVFAKDNGANYKLLKLLNPWLRKSSLTVAPGKVYYLSLPKDKLIHADDIMSNLIDTVKVEETNFNPDGMKGSDSFQYIVSKDETLQTISKKYGVSVDDLKKWNNLKTNEVKEGDKLLIKKLIQE
jgi:membrane-bound lytic murein transglycosylase D